MKVSELVPGMLIVPAGQNECFSIYGQTNERWLRVRNKPRFQKRLTYYDRISVDTQALYLGTKKDLNIDMEWTNRFVLIDREVVGVDPSAWRRMKPAGSS